MMRNENEDKPLKNNADSLYFEEISPTVETDRSRNY